MNGLLFIVSMLLWVAVLVVFGLLARVAYNHKNYKFSIGFVVISAAVYLAGLAVLFKHFGVY